MSVSPVGVALAPFAYALQDARTRIIPTLRGGGGAAPLASALVDLEATLAQPDTGILLSAVGRARADVTALQTEGEDLQDLDAIMHALDGIENALRAALEAATAAAPCVTPDPEHESAAAAGCQ